MLEVHAAGRLSVPVVVEAAWMIESRIGPQAAADFLRSVNAGELTRIDLTDADWERVAELVATYADRSGHRRCQRRRHRGAPRRDHPEPPGLRVVRPHHVTAFELLP